jgi:hypothetical protein
MTSLAMFAFDFGLLTSLGANPSFAIAHTAYQKFEISNN